MPFSRFASKRGFTTFPDIFDCDGHNHSSSGTSVVLYRQCVHDPFLKISMRLGTANSRGAFRYVTEPIIGRFGRATWRTGGPINSRMHYPSNARQDGREREPRRYRTPLTSHHVVGALSCQQVECRQHNLDRDTNPPQPLTPQGGPTQRQRSCSPGPRCSGASCNP